MRAAEMTATVVRLSLASSVVLFVANGPLALPQSQPRSSWDFPSNLPKYVPPPQGNILALHFSRDGRFVLAQDRLPLLPLPSGFKQRADSVITVLTVQPLAILFRVVVDNARFAGFTPDSKEVIFVSGEGDYSHVERWRVADGTQVGSFKIATADCVTIGLAPDGRTLLCAYGDGTLRATDVASQETILERRKWGRELDIRAPDTGGNTKVASAGKLDIYFSPDGRYAITSDYARSIAWDLRQGEEVRMSGSLAHMRDRNLAFIEPERVLLSSSWQQKHGVVTADLVEFPSGKVESKPKIPPYSIFPAADPAFVIVRPFDRSLQHAAAAANLTTGKVIISVYTALDAFGQFYVAESDLGEVGLYQIDKGLQAKIKLQ